MSQLRIGQPGRPTVVVVDVDPFNGLTQRQRQILDLVRSYNGNRSRAARQLGITVQSVQHAVRAGVLAGVRVPESDLRGPDLAPRRPRGDGARLTEADLFAASSIGVRRHDVVDER